MKNIFHATTKLLENKDDLFAVLSEFGFDIDNLKNIELDIERQKTKRREYLRKWQRENKARCAEYCRKFYNSEKGKVYFSSYNESEKRKAYIKEYNSRLEIIARNRERARERYYKLKTQRQLNDSKNQGVTPADVTEQQAKTNVKDKGKDK